MSNIREAGSNVSFRSDGVVLRSDVMLRAEYPHLVTRIFEIGSHQYLIVFAEDLLDASSISDVFASSIRIAHANVGVSNNLPGDFIRELQPIADAHLSKAFLGLPFRTVDIYNVLATQFRDLDVVDIRHPGVGRTQIVVSNKVTADQKKHVEEFCNEFGGQEFEVIRGAVQTLPSLAVVDNTSYIKATKFRPNLPPFVREDEAFWMENLDAIYSGDYRPNILSEPDDPEVACYIDFTHGGHQINLRQALMLYDKIFITPPVRKNIDSWISQKLGDDFLSLVESGRVKLILTQQEELLDISFLEAVHSRNPQSLFGPRRASAIVLSDLVNTARTYRLNDPTLRSDLSAISGRLGENLNVSQRQILKRLMWPLSALRGSVTPMMDSGPLGIAAFGVGHLLEEQAEEATNRKIDLQSQSVPTHLAHALNATLIPEFGQADSELAVCRAIGDGLNFYRSFNSRIAAAWVGNEERKEERKALVPALPLFEFDPDVPLSEIIEASSRPSVRRKGRALLNRLSGLNPQEVDSEIGRLDQELRRLKARKEGVFSLEALDEAATVAEWAADPFPPLFTMFKLLRRVLDAARRSPAIDRLIDAISQDVHPSVLRNEDLDFLSKVDRVAVLKRRRIS